MRQVATKSAVFFFCRWLWEITIELRCTAELLHRRCMCALEGSASQMISTLWSRRSNCAARWKVTCWHVPFVCEAAAPLTQNTTIQFYNCCCTHLVSTSTSSSSSSSSSSSAEVWHSWPGLSHDPAAPFQYPARVAAKGASIFGFGCCCCCCCRCCCCCCCCGGGGGGINKECHNSRKMSWFFWWIKLNEASKRTHDLHLENCWRSLVFFFKCSSPGSHVWLPVCSCEDDWIRFQRLILHATMETN